MSRQREGFVTAYIKASLLVLGLFLLLQYVKGKHDNGAYFHSQNAAANPACHHKPPPGALNENTVKTIRIGFNCDAKVQRSYRYKAQ